MCVKLVAFSSYILSLLLSLYSHVFRIKGHHLPEVIFYSKMSKSKRKYGGQHLRYKDVRKRYLKSSAIDPTDWERLASHRCSWHSTDYIIHTYIKLTARGWMHRQRSLYATLLFFFVEKPSGVPRLCPIPTD